MNNDKNWLTLDEAANYLGVGKTTLYTKVRSGRIPGKKTGKKWAFEKSELDAWLRSAQSIEDFFRNSEFDLEESTLRLPQREAYARVRSLVRDGRRRLLVQIPVGCGKSGLCAILPFGIAEGRVLVISPNLTIKNELFDAMDITNRQKNFWRKTGFLSTETMLTGPYACTLDSGNMSVVNDSHIVITNIQQLATREEKWLGQFADGFFDMIIIDEAHHSAADSWRNVIDRFPNAKVVLLTATPFRSDRQEIGGELAFRYPFRNATINGYIKRLKASYVAPASISLDFADDKGKTYSLDDVLKLKDETWFSRGVALAMPCNQHIVDTSLEKLTALRQSGTQHQLVAVACSISHAQKIRSLYRERGFNADVIHSRQKPEEKDRVLRELRNGILDCIVQVQMLGEGFDHPKLSVAAIFRPFRTLGPYVQFVGRIMRVVVQNDATHPDNLGHIVTHLGMGLDKRVQEFRQFENDDQAFWRDVVSGEEPPVPPEVLNGSTRLRPGETVTVNDEVVESLWEEDLTSIEDQHIVDDLRERMKLLGLDPSSVEAIVKNAQPAAMRKRPPTEAFAIQPQSAWKEARKRLNEEAKRLAKILLNHAELEMSGTEMRFKFKGLRLTGRNNFVCALMMVNTKINDLLGADRNDATTMQLQEVMNKSELVLNPLARKLRKAKTDYEKKNA